MIRELMNTKQAAEYLQLSKPHLDRLRLAGGGPRFAKIGKGVRYRKVDLDAWVESRLVSSTSEKAA